MNDHLFYFGLLVVGFVALAMFMPANTITGFSVGECPDCGKLCDTDDACSGLVCCPTAWESGVCQHPQSCAAIADISIDMSYEEYTNPERAQSIHNIAWKNFGIPVLVIIGLIALMVYRARH